MMRSSRTFLLPLCALVYACGSSSGDIDQASIASAPVHPEQATAIAKLETATQSKWSFTQSSELGTLSHLSGRARSVLVDRSKGFDATTRFLENNAALFRMRSPSSELRETRSRGDALGMHHVRMQQMVRGVPVWAREMAAHYDASGSLVNVEATYAPNLESLDVNPKLTLADAIANAKADLAASRTVDPNVEIAVEDADLMVYAPDEGIPGLGYHMRLRIEASESIEAVWDDYMIDAHTGVVINKFNNLQHAEGVGQGVLGDQKKIQVGTQAGRFVLYDATRTPNGIHTFDSQNTQQFGNTYVSSTGMGTFSGPGVDAHFFAGVVYDFYKQKLNRLGLDGADGAMFSYVRYSVALDNAFWDGRRMAYGDGGRVFRPLAGSLDVVAHEFTHGVTQTESNLTYQGQSGALNESLSDIFGAIIENFLKPDVKNNFLMGEAIGLQGPIRDMINPAAGDQPSHMSEYVRTQQDNGGVHINSGIPNNAMALMTIGGTNPKSGVKVAFGIGWDKAAKLWYRVNTDLLLAGSTFTAAATATQTAANDLGFTQNEKNIVECAWIATGVQTGTCKTITAPPSETGSAGNTGSDAGRSANTAPVPGSDSSENSAEDDDSTSSATAKKKKKTYDISSDAGGVGCQSAGDMVPRDFGLVAAAVAFMLAGRRRKRNDLAK